ncbi:MAG: biosynthetic-type acetolactate synthase large subunit [Oscillospiraceae bacterium]|nr:biosynthetic-type acetolactate synthase large subunit [Oscillospiraceae bacterium]
MITGAQALVAALKKQNVNIIFGYPGVAICPFYNELSASGIRHILVRQEQNAGHAASGYARINGRPAVCAATSGPGAVNLITALATAYMDSIPLVAITGQVSSDLLGRDVFQEADITGAAEPFTKYSYLVKDPADIPRIVNEAFYIAGTGRPGPVLIDLPIDIQQAEFDETDVPDAQHLPGYNPTTKGHKGQINRVVSAIKRAKKPLLCIGGGVISANAQNELRTLCETAGLPAVSTMMGLGALPTTHSNYFGMLGTHGHPYANYAVQQADLLIIIGARVGDRAVSAPEALGRRAKIVHIDVDPAEIGKNLGTTIPVVGDAKTVLDQLTQTGAKANCGIWMDDLDDHRRLYRPDLDPRPNGGINPKGFLRTVSLAMENDSIIVGDVGQNQTWTAGNIMMRGGKFLTSGGMGTMGYSIPAAIGAKLADPQRQVVAVCGDGSFQMSMCELATAVQHNVPIKIIVMNNHSLGMVLEYQTQQYNGNHFAVELGSSPDICALAAAYGIPSRCVTDDSQTDEAIRRLLDQPGPALLECRISPDEASR